MTVGIEPPWTRLGDLIDGLDGVRLDAAGAAGRETPVRGVCHDSRAVRAGSLFVALPGRVGDGRRFVDAALAAGAAAVALPAGDDAPDFDGGALRDTPVLRLDAPRRALAALSARAWGNPASALRICAVTGTNGKTTVANLLGAMVEADGRTPAVLGTVGNRIGARRLPADFTTPEAPTLHALFAESVAAGVEILAMEVSSIGLAERRVDGIAFEVAAFTNLSVDHLDYHGTLAEYELAKRRLFTELLAPGGSAVICVDDSAGRALVEAARAAGIERICAVGDAEEAQVRWSTLRVTADGVAGRLQTPAGALDVDAPLLGAFNAQNVAVAVGVAQALGLGEAAIRVGLTHAAVPGRMQRVAAPDRSAGSAPAVVVDYAHTPDALARALAGLRALTRGRLLCVFGCGGDRDTGKRASMGAAAALADAVIITNDNPRSEAPERIALAALEGALGAGMAPAPRPGTAGVCVELDRRAAIAAAVAAAGAQDVVLIAGKGHERYQEANGERRPFDDVAEARTALDAWREEG